MNKKILALHFSSRAEGYDRLALLQREVAFQLVGRAFDSESGDPARYPDILELGCGTGFLTRYLLQRLAPRQLVALDLAEGMLLKARAGLNGSADRLTFLRADCERPPLAPGSFDLVATSLTLQWLESLETGMEGIFSLLRPGGRLVFATLARGTFRELRESYRTAAGQLGIRLAAGRYGPALPGEVEIRDLLEHAGFGRIELETLRKLEFFPSCPDFLRSLKARGANNPNFRPMSLAVERSLLSRVASHYERRYTVDGRVYAGYEVVFGSAWRLSEEGDRA